MVCSVLCRLGSESCATFCITLGVLPSCVCPKHRLPSTRKVSMAAVTCCPGRKGSQTSCGLLILLGYEILVLMVWTLSWPGIMKPMIQQDTIGGSSCRSEDQNCQAGQAERKTAPLDPVPVWGQESYTSLQSKGYSLSHQKQADNMTMEGLHARWVQNFPVLMHAVVGGAAVNHLLLKSRCRVDPQDISEQAKVLIDLVALLHCWVFVSWRCLETELFRVFLSDASRGWPAWSLFSRREALVTYMGRYRKQWVKNSDTC